MRVNRIIIYPKDVQLITGKSERYGRSLLKRIKAHFKKADHQLVSVEEFCTYTGLKQEHVTPLLNA
ncbi:MAG: hypothetical protein DYG99_16765 [Bacteroidetes bacterium CHB5]|nr:hypothetical protein [Bacteroidetes bacterium CHB5]